ncbi:MAG: hypothetical protein OEX81_05295 [Candidatus Pacebacteria bacterium]|nr:hypothetical protein [Candidatus Paceibacterota bacterium]
MNELPSKESNGVFEGRETFIGYDGRVYYVDNFLVCEEQTEAMAEMMTIEVEITIGTGFIQTSEGLMPVQFGIIDISLVTEEEFDISTYDDDDTAEYEVPDETDD